MNRNKLLRNAILSTMIGITAIITGSTDNSTPRIDKHLAVVGYTAHIIQVPERMLDIGVFSNHTYEKFIHAVDYNRDGRYDAIYLYNIPKGDTLENFANIKTLDSLSQEVIEHGVEYK